MTSALRGGGLARFPLADAAKEVDEVDEIGAGAEAGVDADDRRSCGAPAGTEMMCV